MVAVRFKSDGGDDVTLKLDRFRQNMDSADRALADMAVHMRTKVFGRTFRQRGTDGAPWAALSPAYAEWKAMVRPGQPILRFDGDLENSMTSPRGGIFKVRRTGYTVGTDIPYASAHQYGTGRMPARPIIGKLSQRDKAEQIKILQRHIVEGTA